MDRGRGSNTGRVVPQSRTIFRADGKEVRDWLRGHLASRNVGEIAQDADMTKRGAENVRAGEHGIRIENLVAMCRNDPLFRAAFFEFCGGELELPPDLTAVINRYVRAKQ